MCVYIFYILLIKLYIGVGVWFNYPLNELNCLHHRKATRETTPTRMFYFIGCQACGMLAITYCFCDLIATNAYQDLSCSVCAYLMAMIQDPYNHIGVKNIYNDYSKSSSIFIINKIN